MFKLKISIFLFSLFTCFQAKALQVEGNILNFSNTEVAINILFGRFHLMMDDIKIPVDKQGSFSIYLDIKEIRFAELTIGDHKFQLFLNPAYKEPQIITLNYNDPKNTLKFEGSSKYENTFLNNRPFPIYHRKMDQLTPQERKAPVKVDAFCDAEEAIEMSKLNEIRASISESSYKLLESEIKNYYLIIKIQAGLYISQQSLKNYETYWRARNDQLVSQIECNTNAVNKYAPYYNHLIAVVYDHWEKKYYINFDRDSLFWFEKFDVKNSIELNELMAKDSYNKPSFVISKENMASCPAALEKFLATRIHRSLADGDFENLAWLFNEFKKMYTYSPYLEVLEPKMNSISWFEDNKNKGFANIHFYPLDNTIQSLDEIISRTEYKGKVILIDIWGTWCGPCREEFLYLKDLKTKLKDKDVEYLYLANEKVAKSEAYWQEVAKYFNLTGYHFYLNEAVLQDFWSKVEEVKGYQIYPTYMIINKNGIISISKAAKPSEGDKLYNQLLAVLKE
ncbi:MAG: TlpA disulfide reductase family protein [Saprospiraceae bacterium]|nr:TlpA disulfide reductase family protein [Saprospiraceae bacterium]